MLKKIILGIIISTVVLTVGAGALYAYQKNSNPTNEAYATNNRSYGVDSKSGICSNFKVNRNNQYRQQQDECNQLNCLNENCQNQNRNNGNYTDYTNQYNNMENNRYRYNNNGTDYQNQNSFCYRYNNEPAS